MLRPYFMHHRRLLGPLCTVAWQTIRELMAAAADDPKFRPGMVAVVQTFGDQLNAHPHVHALVTRGGWTSDGTWLPMPYVSATSAEQLFRHKILRLLQREGLLDEDRTRLLLSWHHSGFSGHNSVTVPAGDGRTLEALALDARDSSPASSLTSPTPEDTSFTTTAPTPASYAVARRPPRSLPAARSRPCRPSPRPSKRCVTAGASSSAASRD